MSDFEHSKVITWARWADVRQLNGTALYPRDVELAKLAFDSGRESILKELRALSQTHSPEAFGHELLRLGLYEFLGPT